MLNSIQRTSNYQNSRPNFGMAIRRNATEKVLGEIGHNISGLRELETLTRKAADNSAADVGLATAGTEGIVLIDEHNVRIPNSFIPKQGTWLETIRMGVTEAENKKPAPLPKVEEGSTNEAERLIDTIKTLSQGSGYYQDHFSQMG